MSRSCFLTAIGTPLDERDRIDEQGLEAHLADQWAAGIDGVLVAGTMGAMQLIADEAYKQLVERAAALCQGKGELLVGAGDASLPRTLDRIELLNRYPIDGVAVLSPYVFRFSQAELIDYFRYLADASRVPVYLYDLPALTGTKIEIETMVELMKHPNIRGAKCSDHFGWTRQLIDQLKEGEGDDPGSRIIVAQPDLVDTLIHHGIGEFLDGIFGLAPQWTTAIGHAADAGDWQTAASHQRDLSALRRLYAAYGGMPTMTVVLNARGIRGRYHPRPYRDLSPERRKALLDEPVVQKLLQSKTRASRATTV